ncbi:glycerophosphodiester phosphodiesterase family protein [Rhizobium sp. ICMP 5592]|uniref:glycerophosphodiester phosphodiesterase n=1 Tax=Rhizobium sp. ICMP 5592 TaxID=2292445 RepID=UPI0012968321|nr:glycerophosphodiester phosphodiesterase family protein [Rhizobium sp. ICMP 5592]MQB41492.1 glycerophosphodiester phosphodiesterase [Rhizobium sp. ICMP 5592]
MTNNSSTTPDRRGLHIEWDGHRCRLKWHRGRRFAADIAFTQARIVEGMTIGASVEIDLQRYGGDGFVVLHDEDLHPATTGKGALISTTREDFAHLRLRDSAGNRTAHPILLIEDLAALIRDAGYSPDAVLQLDLKAPSSSIGDGDIAAFAKAIAPVARSVVLSAGDAEAVERLSEAVPAMPIGFDPCHNGAKERLRESRDFAGFVAGAIAASPRAKMIYLAHELILFADAEGFDLIGAFHAHGLEVDAYTIRAATYEILPKVMRLLALRVDQITTDDPVGLEALVAGESTGK